MTIILLLGVQLIVEILMVDSFILFYCIVLFYNHQM